MNTFPVFFVHFISEGDHIFTMQQLVVILSLLHIATATFNLFRYEKSTFVFIVGILFCCCHHLQFNCLHDGKAQVICTIQYTKKLA